MVNEGPNDEGIISSSKGIQIEFRWLNFTGSKGLGSMYHFKVTQKRRWIESSRPIHTPLFFFFPALPLTVKDRKRFS
jgi:hypothetical protein